MKTEAIFIFISLLKDRERWPEVDNCLLKSRRYLLTLLNPLSNRTIEICPYKVALTK